MKVVRFYFLFLWCVLLINPATAQLNTTDSMPVQTSSGFSKWSFAASAYHYIIPNGNNSTTLLGYADFNALHFEARYNYEGEKTASVFGGYRFESGNMVIVGITPLVGFVFGNIKGFVPGVELDLSWKKFDIYSETEYVIDFEGKENNYLYTWSELAFTPFEKFRTGVSINRTRLYESELELQRGIFAEYSFWKCTAGVHYFNPFSSDGFLIATLGIQF